MSLDINRPDLTVGVVGTGAMGRGIAQVTAQGGIKAILFDAVQGGAAKAKAGILDTLKGLVAKGRLTDADVAKTEANLGVASTLDDLKACHVIVEAVFENLEVKQKLFGELEAVVSPETIIASNTSSIRISSIARALKHRERVCGMHYFNPVPLMKLVEVIRAADTAQWVVAAMTALGQRQTRVPVVVGDTPGYGAAYTDNINSSSGTQVSYRIVVMAAIRNGVAIAVWLEGPDDTSFPSLPFLDHPSFIDLDIAIGGVVDDLVNSIQWRSSTLRP